MSCMVMLIDMIGNSKGGDDSLISGLGSDTMYGDAFYLDASATGGNDILNAAKGGKNGGADVLYGDASYTLEDEHFPFLIQGYWWSRPLYPRW